MSGEFWLGNNNLRRLTGTNKWELRVDLVAWDGTQAYSRYGSFEVRGDEYTLLVADKKPGGGAGTRFLVYQHNLGNTGVAGDYFKL